MPRPRRTANDRAKRAAESLTEFIQAAPSSFHAAELVADKLELAGFTRLREDDDWFLQRGGYVVVRDGAVAAWRISSGTVSDSPFAIVGSHTDSPGFRLKPIADHEADGWRQLAVEVYGGPLFNSWLDRELSIAGRVALRDGTTRLIHTEPIARIPQLAIHLDRGVNAEGLKLDPQRHLRPVLAPGDGPTALNLIAEEALVSESEIVGWDLALIDSQEPQIFGTPPMLAAPRLDNLLSVAATMSAIEETVPDGVIPLMVAFDHEEVGSRTRSGAGGSFLEDVIDRIRDSIGSTPNSARRGLAASWCISSDVGHSVHPNYPERHDDDVRPVAGSGPILKVNANQQYTSDAPGAALWKGVCETAGVSTQTFVSNNTVPCGITIGPLIAERLGVRTVDVGVPILSMHSARELCAASDAVDLQKALAVFFAGAWPERPAH